MQHNTENAELNGLEQASENLPLEAGQNKVVDPKSINTLCNLSENIDTVLNSTKISNILISNSIHSIDDSLASDCSIINIKRPMSGTYTNDCDQALIIFDARKHPQNTQQSYCLNSYINQKPSTKVRHILKCKRPKRHLKKKLTTYYQKSKKYSEENEGELLFNSILKMISRTSLLKRGHAKENLTEEQNNIINKSSTVIKSKEPSQITLINIEGNIQHHNVISLNKNTHSSIINLSISQNELRQNAGEILTIKKEDKNDSLSDSSYYEKLSSYSNSSQDTLKRIDSNLSHQNSYISNVISSVLDSTNLTNENVTLNMAIDKKSTPILNHETSSEHNLNHNNEIIRNVEQNHIKVATKLTSSSELFNDSTKVCTLDISDASNETLTIHSKLSEISKGSDTFIISSTSSYFNKAHDTNLTITTSYQNNLSQKPDIEQTFLPPNDKKFKETFFDSLVNIQKYLEIPDIPNANNNNLKDTYNNVIVTDNHVRLIPKKDHKPITHEEYSKVLLQKSFDLKDTTNRLKSLKLPNEAVIKEIITETGRSQKKSCSEEFRSFTPFSELWDKLTLFLDLAVKRMEESLSERIISELKKSLNAYEKYAESFSAVGDEFLKYNILKKDVIKNIGNVEMTKKNIEVDTQCNLVENQIIDELMLEETYNEKTKKLACSSTKMPRKLKISRSNQPHVYIDVLKDFEPIDSKIQIKDSILTSSEVLKVENFRTYHRYKTLLDVPIKFFRTNARVISSVPMFFFAMFIIYGFIVMLVKAFH